MTAQIKRFRVREPFEVDAVQVVLGVTTKSDILAICPRANVGVPALTGGTDDPSSTDLRWVVIPTPEGLHEVVHGEWIVRVPKDLRHWGFNPITEEIALTPGEFRVMSPEDFHGWFQPIEGEQRG